ncbi:MAG: hypothetical protein RMJ53_03075 [Chitinophagales bacterium]|nr:hypothetical protein [Chitinophagales bacterium]
MKLTFHVTSSICNVPLAEWQQIVPKDNLLHQYEYLKSVEECLERVCGFRYVLIYENKSLTGAAYFQIVQFNGKQLNNYSVSKSLVSKIQRTLLSVIKARLLVGANLLMTGEKAAFFKRGLEMGTSALIYSATVKELMRIDKEVDAFLMPDIYAHDTELLKVFEGDQFHIIREEPDMFMTLNPSWNTFEDYKKNLLSKYRIRTNKCLKLSEHIERKELSEQEIKEQEHDIFALYQNTLDKVPFSLISVKREFFAAQKRILPNTYHIFGYFVNNKLVGFNSIYLLNNTAEVHYVGINYEINKSCKLYLRMLLDSISYSIENKLSMLHFGRTATEIKSSVGAQPMAIFGVLRHKNFLYNQFIVGPLSKKIQPQEAVIRRPFNTQYTNQ